jgi:hypothetical protein
MPAFQAQTQMHPRIAAFQAFFAAFRRVRFHFVNMVEMRAGLHLSILQLSIEDKRPRDLLASFDMVTRWLAFVCAIVSLACFALPMYVIRPFRHQGATELSVALFVKQIGPALSIACALMALAAVIFAWPKLGGWLTRSAMVAALLLAAAGAFLTRVNVYEHMFHPLGAPHFESANEAHVESDDMVIAVLVNGAARAYPIREMAYHHVVNDTVAGEPIVSTY